MSKKFIAKVVIVSLFTISIAIAGGYQLNEQGARAVGMGGAFVATASDPSAIYYNPAGLAKQNGVSLLLGSTFIAPTNTFKQKDFFSEINSRSKVFTPISFYLSSQINDKTVFGFGIFSPFYAGTEWKTPYKEKFILNALYFNPSIAYEIVEDQVMLGIGLSYVRARADIQLFSDYSYQGTGDNYNVNLGLLLKSDWLSVGLSYRSQTIIKFYGSITTPTNEKIAGRVKIPMPGSFSFGTACTIIPKLRIETDLQYTQWSAYKGLELTADAIAEPIFSQEKKWEDNVIFRGGIEYQMDDQTQLRCGGTIDLTPQAPSKTQLMLPDGDRLGGSIGVSRKIGNNLSVDVAYMFVWFMEREAKGVQFPYAGTYKANQHVISMNIGYSF